MQRQHLKGPHSAPSQKATEGIRTRRFWVHFGYSSLTTLMTSFVPRIRASHQVSKEQPHRDTAGGGKWK